LNGEKTIESRWSVSKRRPWGAVQRGDTVYFKNSGEPVAAKANVLRVVQYAGLTPAGVKKILNEYGQKDGMASREISSFFERFRNKKYCILIFLKDPARVRPFAIRKKGFGAMAAWISVADISGIRRARKASSMKI
jgi:ASC-1-like (ASCH) protein